MFNVSACAWNEDAEEDIVTVLSKDAESQSNSGSENGSGDSNSSSLSRGAVAGIAIAAVVGALALVAALVFFIRRQRQKSANKATPPESDFSVLSGPLHNPFPPEPSSSEQSPPDGSFWSPDAVRRSQTENYNGGSSGDGIQNENSVDERGLELDGQNIQAPPVYHELGGREVEKPVSPSLAQTGRQSMRKA